MSLLDLLADVLTLVGVAVTIGLLLATRREIRREVRTSFETVESEIAEIAASVDGHRAPAEQQAAR